jgi:membrane protein DedA with SNARE-associated domain
MDFITNILGLLINFAHKTGYIGIFIMTFLESTFVPIPSEVTMIPVGYLIYKGDLNIYWVMIVSTVGAIGGSLLNYSIAIRYGRNVLEKYGHYLFLNKEKLLNMENFFKKHGAISTFSGRLIPGLRHFISFPAGLAKMNISKFMLYTGLGSACWMFSLLAVGYFIGRNEERINDILPIITIAFIALALTIIAYYIYKQRKK